MATFSTNEILKAIQIIAQSETNALQLDKTIIAQIVSIINLETGEYKVKYEGNIFSAFAATVSETYNVDDSVYVKIPQNDMSKRKIIEGRASGSRTFSEMVSEQTAINQVGPTWDQFYGYNPSAQFGIVAGVEANHRNYSRLIWEASQDTQGDAFFQDYSKTYKYIKIEASFLTRFVMQHNDGNYGLIITFRVPTAEGNIDKVSYKLDIRNFVGSPFNYTTWSPQSIVIDVQNNYLLGLDSILLFQNDFETDKSINYDGDIIYENVGDDDNYNILVKDINLSFVELIDMTDSLYYLDITTPQGISFITGADTLNLVGKLKYQGKDIMEKSTCSCYWYKQNLEIAIGNEKYDKLAGPRWERITENDFNKLQVSAHDVPFRTKYRLITVYNESILTKDIILYRYNSSYDYKIVQVTSGNDITLEIQNINGYGDLTGKWYFSLPDGSYSYIYGANILNNGNKLKINDYLMYTIVNFYCEVYDGENLVSTEEFVVQNSSQQDDVIVTYTGDDVYQYDANGTLAYEDTETDRTLAAIVTWKEGFGSAYSISWSLSNGTPIEEDRNKAVSPNNSMMQNLWVDIYNVLHYNVRQKYKLDYNDNTVVVTIKTVDGHEYSFSKEILFLKDGDQGTNGTTYVCAIRPVDLLTGLKLSGNHALSYNNDWGSCLNLRCYIYRDGELINDSSDYEIDYEWQYGGSPLSINKITGFINRDDYRCINGSGDLDTSGDYLVKMIATIKKKERSTTSNWDDNTMIYCQYPVDITVGDLDISTLTLDLPSYIKYSAAGTDPYTQTSVLICKNDSGIQATLSATKPFTTFTIVDKNYRIDEATFNSRFPDKIFEPIIDPIDKFLYRRGIGAIKCLFDNESYLLHPVMMYLNTYGNETINGWDGTSVQIDKNGNGAILAPQVGAGKKNGDGSFTGVIMGRQQGVEDNEVFGLFGYKEGISTFGLKEDGTSYIGAAGEGQIIFDGSKKGVIESGNYQRDGQSGTRMELSSGKIDSWNFTLTAKNMKLDSPSQRFLFNIGDSNSYFRINAEKENENESPKTLINISPTSYYLQTEDFQQETSITAGSGTKIDLKNNRLTSYDFTIKTPYMELDSGDNKGRFSFDVRGGGSFQIQGENKVLMYVATSSYYLQSDNYSRTVSEGIPTINGVKINLKTGAFYVGGTAEFSGNIYSKSGNIGGWTISEQGLKNSDGSIYFYSNDSSACMKIGNDFSVSSGGTLTAKNAVISGTITASWLTCNSGNIGGWTISNSGFYSSNGSIYLYSDGSMRVGNNFSVTSGGILSASGANIDKTLTFYSTSTIDPETGLEGTTPAGIIKANASTSDGAAFRIEGTNSLAISVNSGFHMYLYGGDYINIKADTINLTSTSLNVSASASNQQGIYARFAS